MYQYAGNNPLMFKDPKGRIVFVVGAAAFAVGAITNAGLYAATNFFTDQPITVGGKFAELGKSYCCVPSFSALEWGNFFQIRSIFLSFPIFSKGLDTHGRLALSLVWSSSETVYAMYT